MNLEINDTRSLQHPLPGFFWRNQMAAQLARKDILRLAVHQSPLKYLALDGIQGNHPSLSALGATGRQTPDTFFQEQLRPGQLQAFLPAGASGQGEQEEVGRYPVGLRFKCRQETLLLRSGQRPGPDVLLGMHADTTTRIPITEFQHLGHVQDALQKLEQPVGRRRAELSLLGIMKADDVGCLQLFEAEVTEGAAKMESPTRFHVIGAAKVLGIRPVFGPEEVIEGDSPFFFLLCLLGIDPLADLRPKLKGDTTGVRRVDARIDADLHGPLDARARRFGHHVAEQPALHAAFGDHQA